MEDWWWVGAKIVEMVVIMCGAIVGALRFVGLLEGGDGDSSGDSGDGDRLRRSTRLGEWMSRIGVWRMAVGVVGVRRMGDVERLITCIARVAGSGRGRHGHWDMIVRG